MNEQIPPLGNDEVVALEEQSFAHARPGRPQYQPPTYEQSQAAQAKLPGLSSTSTELQVTQASLAPNSQHFLSMSGKSCAIPLAALAAARVSYLAHQIEISDHPTTHTLHPLVARMGLQSNNSDQEQYPSHLQCPSNLYHLLPQPKWYKVLAKSTFMGETCK